MFVMPRGNVMFSRRMTLSENGVHIVQARFPRPFRNPANLDLDFATIGQVHRFRRSKNAVLEDRMYR
jgi:hypothetical protein